MPARQPAAGTDSLCARSSRRLSCSSSSSNEADNLVRYHPAALAMRPRCGESPLQFCSSRSFFVAATLAICQLCRRSRRHGHDLAYSDLLLQSGTGHIQGPDHAAPRFVQPEQVVGATRFYNAGYTGTRRDGQHRSRLHLEWSRNADARRNIPTYGALGEFDRHATWVGMIMGGRPAARTRRVSAGHGSGCSALLRRDCDQLAADNSSFPRFTTAFYFDYFSTLVYGPYGPLSSTASRRQAARERPTSSTRVGRRPVPMLAGIDKSAACSTRWPTPIHTHCSVGGRQTLTGGIGPEQVPTPASGYNNISVRHSSPNGGAYNIPSFFSSGGPNDY